MVENQEDVFYYITLMNENYRTRPAEERARGSSRGCTALGRRRSQRSRVHLLVAARSFASDRRRADAEGRPGA